MKLFIMGMPWDVIHDKNVAMEAGNFGSTHYKTATIFIDPEQSEANKRDTLLHEIMHVILWQTGMEYRLRNSEKVGEEEIIRSISTALLTTLRLNEELITYLLK